ncbi:hypothetical protein U9M48_020786 [Paspalum notatum var. saurae]|uniref:Uncharacterized protein n=1 Tax=Paspalum notatum var. saurae TaxID=547442 RepID=A0AAQ3TFU1_PASNO
MEPSRPTFGSRARNGTGAEPSHRSEYSPQIRDASVPKNAQTSSSHTDAVSLPSNDEQSQPSKEKEAPSGEVAAEWRRRGLGESESLPEGGEVTAAEGGGAPPGEAATGGRGRRSTLPGEGEALSAEAGAEGGGGGAAGPGRGKRRRRRGAREAEPRLGEEEEARPVRMRAPPGEVKAKRRRGWEWLGDGASGR